MELQRCLKCIIKRLTSNTSFHDLVDGRFESTIDLSQREWFHSPIGYYVALIPRGRESKSHSSPGFANLHNAIA